MKLRKLEIKDFRAFYGHHLIEFKNKSQKNLLIYGENGSGKSSIMFAIKYFLESGINNLNFSEYENIFTSESGLGYIKMEFGNKSNPRQYEWSANCTTTYDSSLIIPASQSKGILDYKSLLEIHYVHHDREKINLFDLLINNLLSQCQDSSGITLLSHWGKLSNLNFELPNDEIPNFEKQEDEENIQEDLLELAREEFQTKILNFNIILSAKLNELKIQVNKVIRDYFKQIMEIDFEFDGIQYDKIIRNQEIFSVTSLKNKEIFLKVNFRDKNINKPHHFLNEAKLSAIAIAIYFSSLLISPKLDVKLLVLDDIFIGLDMSNRLPLINVLINEFSDYQVFLMTYDLEWYNLLKQRLDGNKWLCQKLYNGLSDGRVGEQVEIPVWEQDKTFLQKAEDYFNDHKYDIAAVYMRKSFEEILRKFCDKKKLKVTYQENPNKIQSEDFWDAVKRVPPLVSEQELIERMEIYRTRILNPLNHSRDVQIYRQEISECLDTIKNLKRIIC